MRRARLVGPLWRWHRRAGLVAALLLLFLAVSGLLLNHSQGLGLDTRRVALPWLRALYHEAPVAVQAWAAGGRWIAQGASGELLLDAVSMGHCEGRLVGARAWQGMLVAACEQELVLLSAEGERIDALGRAGGLEVALSGLGAGEADLLVRVGDAWRVVDLDSMAIRSPAMVREVALPGVPPPALAARIEAAGGWLTWERALLDLHSGRVFGRFGILAMDIAAVLAIVLSFSGVLIWGLRRRAPRGVAGAGLARDARKENRHG